MRVKICGIRSLQDATWAVDAGADAIGFIFARGSQRFIAPETAREISRRLPPFIARVGVFVDSPPEEIKQIAKLAGLSAIQLHGQEDPEAYFSLGLPLIKALRLKVGPQKAIDYSMLLEEIDRLSHFRQVQGLLIDAMDQRGFGGTGIPLPWLSHEVQQLFTEAKTLGMPALLAGGLTPENVQAGIQAVHPYGVDVSSGVEHLGFKNEALIHQFVRKAKLNTGG